MTSHRLAAVATLLVVLVLGALAAPGASAVETASPAARAGTSDTTGPAQQRADTWRERYAKRFVRKVKNHEWRWVRAQGGASLVRAAKAMPGKRRLRVFGPCYASSPSAAFCDLSNYYALTFERRSSGRIRVDGLFVQD